MGESNRSTRVAAAAGYAALIAAFLGCTDSVTAPAPAQGDASAEASSDSAADSGLPTQTDAGTTDARVTDATPTEASSNDGAAADVTAAADAALVDATVVDASGDAPSTGSMDAGSAADAGVPEAEASAPVTIPPVQMCGVLDSDWGITSDAAVCETASPDTCPDRANTWAAAIVGDFLGTMSADCRISQMATPPSLTDSQQTDYFNAVLVSTLDFFGCPQPGNDAGPVTFGLVPAALWGTQVFTTADLHVITDLYSAAVVQALSDQSTPVTARQLDAINAKLQALAASVPLTAMSSTLTYNTCNPDAGAESGSGAADSAADSGTD